MALTSEAHQMPDNLGVAQIRGMFFAHTLADSAGCAATGQELSQWGQQWWAARRGLPVLSTYNQKWADYLQGALPRSIVRGPLIEDFPILQTVLDDPLWPLLNRLVHPQEDTSCWAAQLRLNGRPLRYFSVRRLERLCGLPRWCGLCGVLGLLGSERSADQFARAWLRTVFADYVLCVASTLPAKMDCSFLYRILDEAHRLGKFGDVAGWPSTCAQFERKLRRLDRIRKRLTTRGWINEEGD